LFHWSIMPTIPKYVFNPRETLPGSIKVTPIPIEAPIHTRPVLQSHHASTLANYTLPYTSTKSPNSTNTFHWPVAILLIFLLLTLGIILSKWGWRFITGQIWKLSSGWKGPLEMEDEEQLLTEPEETQTKGENFTITVEEIPEPGPSSLEDWIRNHPRSI
jgi:hypothetical protein